MKGVPVTDRDECKDLKRALSHAKSLLHTGPVKATMGDGSTVAAERAVDDRPGIEAEIAQIEQALREAGCT